MVRRVESLRDSGRQNHLPTPASSILEHVWSYLITVHQMQILGVCNGTERSVPWGWISSVCCPAGALSQSGSRGKLHPHPAPGKRLWARAPFSELVCIGTIADTLHTEWLLVFTKSSQVLNPTFQYVRTWPKLSLFSNGKLRIEMQMWRELPKLTSVVAPKLDWSL